MSYLTVREVAALLKVTDPTVRRWVWAGKLPATRIGRVQRIKPSDVERLPQAGRPGSAAGLLEAAARCAEVVEPRYVEELERLIAEGCERPGEIGPTIA
jgi:excisionase family DNA binding protein